MEVYIFDIIYDGPYTLQTSTNSCIFYLEEGEYLQTNSTQYDNVENIP